MMGSVWRVWDGESVKTTGNGLEKHLFVNVGTNYILLSCMGFLKKGSLYFMPAPQSVTLHAYFYATGVDCGPPPKPKYGSVKFWTTTPGSKAFYDCSYGYQLSGHAVRKCRANGHWSGDTPSCDDRKESKSDSSSSDSSSSDSSSSDSSSSDSSSDSS